jgi:hypothetical protein
MPSFAQQRHGKTTVADISVLVFGPLEMFGGGTVARFAGDIDDIPCRMVAFGLGVIVLFEVGAVAVSTHEIPVEIDPGPVEYIPCLDHFILMDMEPALAAFCFAAAVPGDIGYLVFSIRKLDEILLQWIDAEGIGYFIVVKLSILSVSSDEELLSFFVKAVFDSVKFECGIVEITYDRFVVRLFHCHVMVRASPFVYLFGVAFDAGIVADVGGVVVCRESREEEKKEKDQFFHGYVAFSGVDWCGKSIPVNILEVYPFFDRVTHKSLYFASPEIKVVGFERFFCILSQAHCRKSQIIPILRRSC